MKIAKEKIEEISTRTNLADLIGEYVTLKSNGNRYVGLCPFHSEKSPSFNVSPAQGFYHCFGCKESGDAFKFLMKIEGLSFTEAAEKLAAKAGVNLEAQEFAPEDHERSEMNKLFSRITTSFSFFLEKSPDAEEARQTLIKRKISPESQKKFQLGYAPQDRRWLYKFLTEKNYTPEFLAKTGLFSSKYPESSFFSGRLIFPIRNHRAENIAFGGRLLGQQEGPKYLNSPENPVFKKRSNLYAIDLALPEIRKTREVYICEGYMDVIALHQAGITTAVAPLGTALTDEQVQFLRRYIDKAIMVFDSDQAGIKATLRSLEIFEKWEVESEVISVPGAKDPAEILEKEGEEALKNSLKSPINGFDYLLDFYYNTFSQTTPMDVGAFLRSIFQFLESVTSEVRKETFLARTAEKLKVSKENLLKDFSKKGQKEKPRPQVRTEVRPERFNSHDFFMMTAVLGNLNLFPLVRRDIAAEDLDDDRARSIFSALEIAFQVGEVSFDSVIGRLADEELKNLVITRLANGEFEGRPEQMVQDGTLMIRKRSLEKKREAIVYRLDHLGQTEEARAQALPMMQEIKFLDGEIKRLKVIHHD